ncbi:MAG TPA: flippase activity-associated protein Agl23 [Verrucomicrobiae bacterium]|nr:flippase activity-associated protein Agl23 [Verrucomicrobiae bacterium]
MKRCVLAGMAVLTVFGLWLRLHDLRLRPMHNDEGVNAMKFQALWVNNNYKYDPNEFHGPTLPYLTLFSAWLSGKRDFNQFTETTFRAVPAIFGAGLILLLLIVAADLGNVETLWAAALIAVSPAMVFYSRYYIHEIPLVFFTAFSFFSLWRYCKSGRLAWALAAGIGLGLMAATKETFVFAIAALGLAIASSTVWSRWREPDATRLKWQGRWTHVLFALAAALVVAALFFSSFFTNGRGLLDAVLAYGPWFRRAGGESIHTHPWPFYFQHLFWFHSAGGPIWSEGFAGALAAVGFFVALFGTARPLLRIIAFYTVWLTLIYTILAYKTPWCLLGFYHGMILLAAVGAASILRACKTVGFKTAVFLVLVIGVAQLGWQARRGNFGAQKSGALYCASPKNPYVYSQTSPDILRLVSTVDGLAHVSPDGYNTVVEVISPQSYWPLPWYLRRFTKVGYWDQTPNQPLAPIMIVSTDLRAAFDERPDKTHLMAGYFQLRPNVFMELYVSTALWAEYVKTLPPDTD